MRGKVSIILMVCLVVTLLALTTWAKAEEGEQETLLIWLREIAVKPPLTEEYHAAMKDYVALCKEHNYPYAFSAWVEPNMNYTYVYIVDDYQAPMNIYKASSEMLKKWGEEKAQNFEKALRTSISSYKDYFVEILLEYSYIPENPRLKAEERNYAIWDIFYVPFDKEAEFFELGKKMVSLMKSKNITEDMYFHTGRLGTKRPFHFVLAFAKDPADFWATNEKMWEQLGKEGGEIYKKTIKLIEKRGFKQFWYEKSLSYEPEEKK